MSSILTVRDRNGRAVKYRARYRTPDGASRSKTFRRRIDAEQFADGVGVSKVQGRFVDPMLGKITVDEWWGLWWPTVVNLRATSRARDEGYYATHIEEQFGSRPLAGVDSVAVARWVADLVRAGKAPATVHKAHQVLAKVMRSAVKAGRLAVSPCDGTELPRVEREEMRFLTPAEAARLADAIEPRYRAFVLLGAYGGLRPAELVGLKRQHVNLLKGRVDVVEILAEVGGRHYAGPPKTKAGRRTVTFPRFVVDELAAHLAMMDGELVFPAADGSPLRASNFRRRIWQPAVEAASVSPLRIHDLRHTAVALWIAAGASPREIATRAGHSSVVTVLDRYGHLLPGGEERVNDALEAMGRSASSDATRSDVIAIASARR